MKRVLLSMSMVLIAACSSGHGTSTTSTSTTSTTYAVDDAAASHVEAAMIADGELLAPNGQPISKSDANMILLVVHDGCQTRPRMGAMIQSLQANPYLLAQVMKIANAACPKLIHDMGIQVNE